MSNENKFPQKNKNTTIKKLRDTPVQRTLSRPHYMTSVSGRLEPTHRRRKPQARLCRAAALLGEQPLADGHRVVLDGGRQRHALCLWRTSKELVLSVMSMLS